MRLAIAIAGLLSILSSGSTSNAFGLLPTFSSVNGVCNNKRPFGLGRQRGGGARYSVNDVVSSDNLNVLSERGQEAIKTLIENDEDGSQKHVYADWPESGIEDEGKHRLGEQLADLNDSYPGGLTAYLSKAKMLLQQSAQGLNPFEDFQALVPEGESLSFDNDNSSSGTMNLQQAETLGQSVMGQSVIVLVAGGLGERLGYSGIKLSLETNLCTNQCYLEYYIKYILAMQAKSSSSNNEKIPLVIMTSGDTDQPTRQLLAINNNFGMPSDQITIVTQDKVAALKDGNAGLALKDDDRWNIQTKPHGHGDVHHLLLREGLIDKWTAQDKKYVVFIQDTNALVVNSILPTLGVSVKKGFHMNSICIPRLAGEAAGAITRLEHKSDPEKSLVINVEYNQLDPLLKSQGGGDVADETTGYSPFPGNANNLVLELDAYAKTLRGEDQGVVVEFVNPKYKDETARTDFKKPTRLECMMQDIPKLFQKEMGREARIGFTTFDRWFTFSPAKNALDAGVASVAKGSRAPGTMSSAESDFYIQNQYKLTRAGGVEIKTTSNNDDNLETVGGIPVTKGPRIVLDPHFAMTKQDIMEKFQGGTITERSSLVVQGSGVVKIRNLQLDGALLIRTADGVENIRVTVDGLVVKNKGWTLEEIPNGTSVEEKVSIRGYTMTKHETAEYFFGQPGNYIIQADGNVYLED